MRTRIWGHCVRRAHDPKGKVVTATAQAALTPVKAIASKWVTGASTVKVAGCTGKTLGALPPMVTMTVSVVDLPPVKLIHEGLDWFKILGLVIPICVAIFGALLSLLANYWLKGREEKFRRRGVIRNAVSTLEAYLDELELGLKHLDELIQQLANRQLPEKGRIPLLSTKAWEHFRLEADYRTELNLLPKQNIEGIEGFNLLVGSLPIHLKNCFEYTAANHKLTVASLIDIAPAMTTDPDWKAGPSGRHIDDLIAYRGNYARTTILTKAAIEGLGVRLNDPKLGFE